MDDFRYIEYVPSLVQDKLLELAQAIEDDLDKKDTNYKAEADKYRNLYFEAINKPCKHLSLRFEKVGGALVNKCNCCGAVIGEYANYTDALNKIDSPK